MHEHDRQRIGRRSWARRAGLALVWLVLLALLAVAATVAVAAAIRLGSVGGLPARQRRPGGQAGRRAPSRPGTRRGTSLQASGGSRSCHRPAWRAAGRL
jgi:hypothetical protein